MRSRLSARGLLVVLLGPAAASLALAQAQRPATEAYKAPALRFDEKGLSLMDAVRLTLQHDPNIKLQDAETRFKEGVAQELAGQFDLTLRGDSSYQYLQQELPDSTKEREIKIRRDLDNAIPTVESLVNGLRRAVENLQNPAVVTDPRNAALTAGITNEDLLNELRIIQSQLAILDDLIRSTTNEALRNDFIKLREQTLKAAIDRFTSQADSIKDLPEELKRTRRDLGDAPIDQWSKQATAHLEVAKQLRNGIFFSPFADVRYLSQNYKGKTSTDPKKGGLGIKDVYKGQLGFDVVLPLRRGLGKSSVAAPERAAGKDLEASRLTLLHQKSQSVLSTVFAYWDLRAAAEQVEVAQRSVKLQADMLTLISELIKAKEKPKADEARVLASYADSQARLEATLRRFNENRVNLARVMGVGLQDPGALPTPADPFPEPPEALMSEDEAVQVLVRQAMNERNDRKATLMVQEGGRVLAEGSRLDMRRVLDLEGKLFGTAVAESSVSDLDRWVFRSASGSLNLEVPFKNNTLEGQFAQRQASFNQASIDAADLARNIALNVVQLAQSLRLAAERVRRAQDAVRSYDKTIEDEQAKLKVGESTLVDAILTEQQTTAARLARVAAQQEYATLLARLRFEAGILVLQAKEQARVTSESLLAVPPPLLGAAPRR